MDKKIAGTTCFKEHSKYSVRCNKTSCKYWINDPTALNCTIISANEGPKTLQEIGDLFNLTRMRICQIEKNTLKKLTQNDQFESLD
jgi:hypothetical protein